MPVIRVVLIEDHLLFRDGLRAMFSRHPDLKIVGEASDAREAIELLSRVEADVIVLDITLPGSNGVALLRELKRRDVKAPVLVATMHQHADMVLDAFAAGATGYMTKHQSEREFVEALRMTAAGKRYLAPQLPRELLTSPPINVARAAEQGVIGLLSAREREIFDLVVRGKTNAEIARELFISIKTVDTHRTRIMKKLDVHSVGDLIRLAARHGFLTA